VFGWGGTRLARTKRRCRRCGNQTRSRGPLCDPCVQAVRNKAIRLGKKCAVCGEPSLLIVCDSCDRRLRQQDSRRDGIPRSQLYGFRGVVRGGLPSLGKRR
jgi:hypothetical protein